jgi:hypothetical protein
MRLFSEEVKPTLTNSSLNTITVKDFNEVFFDVYELEINGSRYIAEKVDNYNGSPVVSLPVFKEGKEYYAPFILNKGNFKVLFNDRNTTFVKNAPTPKVKEVLTELYTTDHDSTADKLFKERCKILADEVASVYSEAEAYADNIKRQKIEEADKVIQQRKEQAEREREELRLDISKIIEEQNKSSDFIKEVKRLRSELEKSITAKFANEVQYLKKMVELGSGGGGGNNIGLSFGGAVNGDISVAGSLSARDYYTTSANYVDYATQAIFKDTLEVGANAIETYPLSFNPILATAKFHANFHNDTQKSVCEIYVMVTDSGCFANVYSVIHTDNNNPLLTSISCNTDNGYLYINNVVTSQCTGILVGNATYQSIEANVGPGV